MKTHITTSPSTFTKTAVTFFMALLLGVWSQTTHAQTTQTDSGKRTVSGIVKTPSGPLPYASVILKGTYKGVQADENGVFTFPEQLSENDVLIISSMAYPDKEYVIEENTTFIESFLEGTEIMIYAALRTKPAEVPSLKN